MFTRGDTCIRTHAHTYTHTHTRLHAHTQKKKRKVVQADQGPEVGDLASKFKKQKVCVHAFFFTSITTSTTTSSTTPTTNHRKPRLPPQRMPKTT